MTVLRPVKDSDFKRAVKVFTQEGGYFKRSTLKRAKLNKENKMIPQECHRGLLGWVTLSKYSFCFNNVESSLSKWVWAMDRIRILTSHLLMRIDQGETKFDEDTRADKLQQPSRLSKWGYLKKGQPCSSWVLKIFRKVSMEKWIDVALKKPHISDTFSISSSP